VSERDLLNWALMVVAAEENARLVAEKLAEKVTVEVTPTPPTFSKTVRMTDIPLPYTLVDETGSGCLKELVVKSRFKDYSLIVLVDGSDLYRNSYDWFQRISQSVEEIDAFEEDGTYVLRLSDIHFAKSLKIVAIPFMTITTTLKLDEVFCKIDLAKTF
jgi:hypothetical protein